ncbi:hypothetical protein Scep_005744 [Stephania cephalantha]|uniref:Methyltransferase n=1 Tax=Stephania cephalantha TaxID=152367 RepID=A0AAP0KVV4_9MAGN
MTPPIPSIFKERKYPFLFAFFVLLICVSALILSNNRFLYPSEIDLTKSQSISSSPPTQSSVHSPPPNGNPMKKKSPVVIVGGDEISSDLRVDWEICSGSQTDYIPCLDNMKAIKALRSRRHMEHRERYCPKPSPRCLVHLPIGYRIPVPWPRSKDMIWYDNVPHPKLVEYKKEQNWVRKSGEYLVFPGGGTQFKNGVKKYIEFVEETLPTIKWGKHTRVVLDVGCGVASFGGYLLDENVVTMSFAPKDEHEAQIQFALERGIPATLSVIATQKLTFPDNVYDLIHCARCRVHWDADGGKPLLELNRILRPGGLFVWSATPVYRNDERDQSVWNAMVALTESICWKTVAKTVDSSGIGLVIYQKPVSNSCYEDRKENIPPLCDQAYRKNVSWYSPLESCLPKIEMIEQREPEWPHLA